MARPSEWLFRCVRVWGNAIMHQREWLVRQGHWHVQIASIVIVWHGILMWLWHYGWHIDQSWVDAESVIKYGIYKLEDRNHIIPMITYIYSRATCIYILSSYLAPSSSCLFPVTPESSSVSVALLVCIYIHLLFSHNFIHRIWNAYQRLEEGRISNNHNNIAWCFIWISYIYIYKID